MHLSVHGVELNLIMGDASYSRLPADGCTPADGVQADSLQSRIFLKMEIVFNMHPEFGAA